MNPVERAFIESNAALRTLSAHHSPWVRKIALQQLERNEKLVGKAEIERIRGEWVQVWGGGQ